jgi:hypothetical protein
MTTTERITGVVDRVNPKGLRLRGEGEWRNYSRYADLMDIETPAVGAHIGIDVDGSGYVRSVQVVGERANERDSFSVRETANEAPQTCSPRPEKDIVVTRLAVLNTATAIASSGGQETDLVTVLALAEELEQWATR